jgi:hypothetical protein
MGAVTRAGVAAAIAAAQVGLAYRFALAYRARAGYPRRFPPTIAPTDVGLAFESMSVRSGDLELPAWFIPARSGERGPGVALIHGWESARDRTLPLATFLHAAGFHCLTIDIRGHGANPAEALPLSAGEFGLDAAAAFEALIGRPVPAHATDVPARAAADPRSDRVPARLAHDPRLSPAAASRRRRDQCERGDRPVRGSHPVDPRRG